MIVVLFRFFCILLIYNLTFHSTYIHSNTDIDSFLDAKPEDTYQKANNEKAILKKLDSFYDNKFDYSTFIGRVSDRDKANNILKIHSKNGNIKFFRAGDLVKFSAQKDSTEKCEGYVRKVEEKHFIIFVKSLHPCWNNVNYFRRGAKLKFFSRTLEERIRDASLHRVILFKRREDYFKQLNSINHFLWSFDQQKVLATLDYDKKILELERAKERAVETFISKKKDQMKLQRELVFRLKKLDKNLKYYRVEKVEPKDRWILDTDMGLPIENRPQEIREK